MAESGNQDHGVSRQTCRPRLPTGPAPREDLGPPAGPVAALSDRPSAREQHPRTTFAPVRTKSRSPIDLAYYSPDPPGMRMHLQFSITPAQELVSLVINIVHGSPRRTSLLRRGRGPLSQSCRVLVLRQRREVGRFGEERILLVPAVRVGPSRGRDRVQGDELVVVDVLDQGVCGGDGEGDQSGSGSHADNRARTHPWRHSCTRGG